MMYLVMKILIISLMKMGDLLQATPLISGLRKKHPDAKFDVLVSSDFASVAKSIPKINEVSIFNLRQSTPDEYEGELTPCEGLPIYRRIYRNIKEI